MQHKIRLLFDMEQLSVSRGKGTGIVRVADVLLKGLLKSGQVDVYPLVTTNRGDVFDYLQHAGLDELREKVVFLPKLRKTCKKDNWYKKTVSRGLATVYGVVYKKKLAPFDAYLSIFSPISPLVYQSRLKTFAFVHDLIPLKFPQFCDVKFAKKYAQWMEDLDADTVFTISESSKTDLQAIRPDLQNVYVVYLGADKNFRPESKTERLAEIKHKYGIKTDKYFLAVSEISGRKNLVHLLKSFARFLEASKAKDISLVLTGPQRAGYEDVLKTLDNMREIQDKVVQTGYVAEEDMCGLYGGATAFVYPSLYEGFGLPILEAMQCGTPVVAADNSSLPEVGGDAALYVSGKDEAETAEVLGKVYADENLREVLKNKGQIQAGKFSWDKFINQVQSIILKEVKNG